MGNKTSNPLMTLKFQSPKGTLFYITYLIRLPVRNLPISALCLTNSMARCIPQKKFKGPRISSQIVKNSAGNMQRLALLAAWIERIPTLVHATVTPEDRGDNLPPTSQQMFWKIWKQNKTISNSPIANEKQHTPTYNAKTVPTTIPLPDTTIVFICRFRNPDFSQVRFHQAESAEI